MKILFIGNGKLAKIIKNQIIAISKKKGFKISIVSSKTDYFDSAIFVNPIAREIKKAKMISSKMNLPVLIISSKELSIDIEETSDYPFVFVISDFYRMEGTGIEKYIENFLAESYGVHGKRVAYCAVKWKNKFADKKS